MPANSSNAIRELQNVETSQQRVQEQRKISWQEIESWVDDDLVLYIQKKLEVGVSEALELLQETKKFLLVANNNYAEGNNLSPSPRVDEAWHCFILFTPVYQEFCANVLKRGAPIPHIPNVGNWKKPATNGGRDINNSYRRTVEAIERETGSLNSKYWPEAGAQGNAECCTPCKAPV
jgi:hypothetical protein